MEAAGSGNPDLIGREIHQRDHREREQRRDNQTPKQEPPKKQSTTAVPDIKKGEKKQKPQREASQSKDHSSAIPLKILPDVAVVPEKSDGVVRDVEMEAPELLN